MVTGLIRPYPPSVTQHKGILDQVTLEELALLGEVIASLGDAQQSLSRSQIDELLGIHRLPRQRPDTAATHGPAPFTPPEGGY
jgi:hypothetical protein